MACGSGRSVKARLPASSGVTGCASVSRQVPGQCLGRVARGSPTGGLRLAMRGGAPAAATGTPTPRLPVQGWETEWFPWKQAALLFLVFPRHERLGRRPTCGPASPSDRGSNLIKHFAAPRFPPPPGLGTTWQLPERGRGAGWCSGTTGLPLPHATCASHAWPRPFSSSDPPPRSLRSLSPGSSVQWPQRRGVHVGRAGS